MSSPSRLFAAARVAWSRRRLTAIRREIARKIVIAYGEDALVDIDWTLSSAEMLASLRDGGVWCSGAATILWRALLERGYRATIGHYGFHPNGMRHSGVLVELHGQKYYYDPFFNFEFEHSFEKAIERYKLTGTLSLIDDGHRPRTIYMASRRGRLWWSLDGGTPDTYPCRQQGRWNVEGFAANCIARGRLTEFAEHGLSKRIENIFLFQFAVTEGANYSFLRKRPT